MEIKERSAAGINVWAALLFKSKGIAEINWKYIVVQIIGGNVKLVAELFIR